MAHFSIKLEKGLKEIGITRKKQIAQCLSLLETNFKLYSDPLFWQEWASIEELASWLERIFEPQKALDIAREYWQLNCEIDAEFDIKNTGNKGLARKAKLLADDLGKITPEAKRLARIVTKFTD